MKTQTKHTPDLETVLSHYLVCALWSSTDEAGEPLDTNYCISDISPASLESARAELADFLSLCSEENVNPFAELSPEQVGHDFWLTRNGHGAGFWDRGLGDHGKHLTRLAKTYGSSDAYVGDDGLIYLT